MSRQNVLDEYALKKSRIRRQMIERKLKSLRVKPTDLRKAANYFNIIRNTLLLLVLKIL